MSGFAIPDYVPLSMTGFTLKTGVGASTPSLSRLQTPFVGDTLIFDQATRGFTESQPFALSEFNDPGAGFFPKMGTGEAIAQVFGGSNVPDNLTPTEAFNVAKQNMLGSMIDFLV